METFKLEREMMAKIYDIEQVIENIRKDVSHQLFRKEGEINIELTQDLRDKCQNYLAGFGETDSTPARCAIRCSMMVGSLEDTSHGHIKNEREDYLIDIFHKVIA